MGFQTLVVINNDVLHEVDKATFGRRLHDAILQVAGSREHVLVGPAIVIDSHHADAYEVVIVGGQTVTHTGAWSSHPGFVSDEHVKYAALKSLANRMGYRVSKIPQKKGKPK